MSCNNRVGTLLGQLVLLHMFSNTQSLLKEIKNLKQSTKFQLCPIHFFLFYQLGVKIFTLVWLQICCMAWHGSLDHDRQISCKIEATNLLVIFNKKGQKAAMKRKKDRNRCFCNHLCFTLPKSG